MRIKIILSTVKDQFLHAVCSCDWKKGCASCCECVTARSCCHRTQTPADGQRALEKIPWTWQPTRQHRGWDIFSFRRGQGGWKIDSCVFKKKEEQLLQSDWKRSSFPSNNPHWKTCLQCAAGRSYSSYSIWRDPWRKERGLYWTKIPAVQLFVQVYIPSTRVQLHVALKAGFGCYPMTVEIRISAKQKVHCETQQWFRFSNKW